MKVQTQYGLRKAKERNLLPETDLIVVPYRGGDLTGRFFGPDTYRNNKSEMPKQYWHSSSMPNISFMPTTTSESIHAAAYGFGEDEKFDAKRDIFDSRWLQAGLIVRTQDGVWTNTKTTNDEKLKQLLNGVKKVNGIYLLDSGIGFAPYETFERGVQDCDTFAQGGLARVLEYSQGKTAENLKAIASLKFYKDGVNVSGFDETKEPLLRVAGLDSFGCLVDDRLNIDSNSWDDSSNGGFAFGVCAPEKSE